MPALSFKRQFIEPIRAGTKRHTIRAAIPRGYAPGLWAPLYCGLRTRDVVLIGSGEMDVPQEVRLDFDRGEVEQTNTFCLTERDALDDFAVSDGFEHWEHMEAFWHLHHCGIRQFTGWLLPWTDFAREHRLGRYIAAAA